MENIEVTVNGLKKDVKSLEYRMDKLEELSEHVNRLATSVEVMAANMEQMVKEQQRLADTQEKEETRIRTLEMQPIEVWDSIKKGIIGCVVSAICGAIIGGIVI